MAVAVRATRRAAEVIEDAARDLKRLPSHAENRDDLVVNAVAEAENAMIATLRTAFPEHAIVGRESGEIASRMGAPGGTRGTFQWIVDPLDGLVNYARGYPCFAISVALTHGGGVTHAVVLDPTRDELFTAIRDNGAQLNDAPIRISMCTDLGKALVGVATAVPERPESASHPTLFDALDARCASVRRSGATALDLAYVAAGRLDAFCAIGCRPWDVAAGGLLVAEAGGRIGDAAGGADFLRAARLTAAPVGLFKPLSDIVTAVRR